MHIPDGFLDIKTLAVTDAASVTLIFLGTRAVQKIISSEKVARMGIATSYVFLVNMFAFPVVGGTSAHLTGVVLVTALIGGWEGFLSSSSALVLQALLFQHGGILTLGANIINIAGWGALLGAFSRSEGEPMPLRGGIFAVLAVLLGSLSCALELWVSNKGSLLRGITAMGIANIIPAVIDGFVTFFVLNFEKRRRNARETQSR